MTTKIHYAPDTVPHPRHLAINAGAVERIIVAYFALMGVSLLFIGSTTLLSLLP